MKSTISRWFDKLVGVVHKLRRSGKNFNISSPIYWEFYSLESHWKSFSSTPTSAKVSIFPFLLKILIKELNFNPKTLISIQWIPQFSFSTITNEENTIIHYWIISFALRNWNSRKLNVSSYSITSLKFPQKNVCDSIASMRLRDMRNFPDGGFLHQTALLSIISILIDYHASH